MNLAMKVVVGALLVVGGVLAMIAVLAFGLWMLIPLAFPALAWSYWNALALSFILFIVGLPWLVKD